MPRLLSTLIVSTSLLVSGSLMAADVTVQQLQDKLDHPWAVAFLPDKADILITERSGQLRLWNPQSGLSEPIAGVPKVWAHRQGGLLDVVLAPDFEKSRRVWLSFTEAGVNGGAGAAVGYGVLSEDNRQLRDFKVVLRQQPQLSSGANLGTRMAFDRDGYLYIVFGDNFHSATAQDLSKL